MKMSELSRRSGASIATIKYYVREGLVPGGRATAANQAEYDDTHVRRLRLIRALVDVGGLSIADVRGVLGALDDDSLPLHEAFGEVMHGLDRRTRDDADPEIVTARSQIREWIASRDWDIAEKAPAPDTLAELVVTARRFGFTDASIALDPMADQFERLARVEVDHSLRMPDRTSAVECMLVGTVVIERIRAEVRRLALEAESARRAAADRRRQPAAGRPST